MDAGVVSSESFDGAGSTDAELARKAVEARQTGERHTDTGRNGWEVFRNAANAHGVFVRGSVNWHAMSGVREALL